jgi:hypothetical protein
MNHTGACGTLWRRHARSSVGASVSVDVVVISLPSSHEFSSRLVASRVEPDSTAANCRTAIGVP